MNEIDKFQKNESHNLRSGIHLASRNMYIAHFGNDTISRLGSNLWKLIPDKRKHASTLSAFKAKINLGPSATAHVDYAEYLLRILVLLKFVWVSNGIDTNAYNI